MRAQAEVDAKKAIESRKDELFNGKDDPVVGAAKSDVVIVEFFDYNCGYCRQMFPSVVELLKEDPKLRLVMKEYPILGAPSVTSSRVLAMESLMTRFGITCSVMFNAVSTGTPF